MTPETATTVASAARPFMEYGFCGLCLIMVGLAAFFYYRQQEMEKAKNKLMSDQTNAMNRQTNVMGRLVEHLDAQMSSNYQLRETVLRRPCLRDCVLNNPPPPGGHNILSTIQANDQRSASSPA